MGLLVTKSGFFKVGNHTKGLEDPRPIYKSPTVFSVEKDVCTTYSLKSLNGGKGFGNGKKG